MSERTQKGVGTIIEIDSTTKAMRRMFKEIDNLGLTILDPTAAHVTLVYPEETALQIYSDKDDLALLSYKREADNVVNEADVCYGKLFTEGHKLRPFGGNMAIELAGCEIARLKEVRKRLSQLSGEILGFTFGSRDYIPHMSVARKKAKGVVTRLPKTQKLPESLRSKDFSSKKIAIGVFSGHRARSAQKYTNRSERAVTNRS